MTFVQGDVADLSPFADASFDLVFSVYALHFVPAIERCLAEVSRVLVFGGQFVFSLDHPFQDCFWDEEGDENPLLVSRSYFQRGGMEWQFGDGGPWMRTFHRTVGDWVGLLHAAGLQIDRILEPEPVLTPEEEVNWSGSYDLEAAKMTPLTIIFSTLKR